MFPPDSGPQPDPLNVSLHATPTYLWIVQAPSLSRVSVETQLAVLRKSIECRKFAGPQLPKPRETQSPPFFLRTHHGDIAPPPIPLQRIQLYRPQSPTCSPSVRFRVVTYGTNPLNKRLQRPPLPSHDPLLLSLFCTPHRDRVLENQNRPRRPDSGPSITQNPSLTPTEK